MDLHNKVSTEGNELSLPSKIDLFYVSPSPVSGLMYPEQHSDWSVLFKSMCPLGVNLSCVKKNTQNPLQETFFGVYKRTRLFSNKNLFVHFVSDRYSDNCLNF